MAVPVRSLAPKPARISSVRVTGADDGSSFLSGQASTWLGVGEQWRLQLGVLALGVCEQAAMRVVTGNRGDYHFLKIWLMSQMLGFSQMDINRLCATSRDTIARAISRIDDIVEARRPCAGWNFDALAQVESDLTALRERFEGLGQRGA